jgi:putative DNA primase/helicase
VAATVSTGRDFPDTPNKNPSSGVLLMIAEDSMGSAVKPRLIAAGANLSNIEFLERVEIRQGARREEREFALDEDLKHLEKKLAASPSVRLVICDTLSSYLVKTEMGKEQPMRKVLLPIASLCEKYRIAFVGVAHFNKRSDVSMIHKASGAVAIVGVPRAAWVFGANKEIPGDFYMLRIKNNLSKVRTGLSYTIAEKKIGKDGHGKDLIAPYIVWREQVVAGEANDLLALEGADERKHSKATKFLHDFLADGPRSADSVHHEGLARGISRMSIFAAKKEAGVFAYKNGATWWWSLEPKAVSSVPKV